MSLSAEELPSKIAILKHQRTVHALWAVGGAVLGAFVHAAVASNVTVTLAVAGSVVVVSGLVLVLLELNIAQQVDVQADKVDSFFSKMSMLRDDIVQVVRQERMTVHYYKAADEGGYRKIYEEALKAVRGAKHSVHALTSYLLDTDPAEQDDRDGKQAYFEGLIDYIKRHPEIAYHRLLQYQGGKELDQIADQQYAEHYLQMDKLRRSNVVLRKMRGTRPTTFVIVDETTLLWQINAVQGQSGMKVLGMFIITDPAKVITNYFVREFDDYWNNDSDRINVQQEFARFLRGLVSVS
ncbi:MAG TPA: hypothetical protein VKK31_26710 [Thermoanaerobaculia bacterium]|nr:hypothetical protein [Thermoanaerobaculia bacterium]